MGDNSEVTNDEHPELISNEMVCIKLDESAKTNFANVLKTFYEGFDKNVLKNYSVIQFCSSNRKNAIDQNAENHIFIFHCGKDDEKEYTLTYSSDTSTVEREGDCYIFGDKEGKQEKLIIYQNNIVDQKVFENIVRIFNLKFCK